MRIVKSLARHLLSLLNQPVARRALQRELGRRGSINLEVGAWRTKRRDWICTDIGWRSTYYLDVTRRWPIQDSTVDTIFSDNVLEHLTLEQSRFFFKEAFRALRPGSPIRTVTPDIGALVAIYSASPIKAMDLRDELLSQGYLIEHQVDLLRFAFQDDGHNVGYLWDRGSIESELKKAGFQKIEFRHAGESSYSQLRGLDTRTSGPLANIMLAVDAQKPPA